MIDDARTGWLGRNDSPRRASAPARARRRHTLARVILWTALLLTLPTLASAQNQPPVADAGMDVTVKLGVATGLLGTATDPDDDPIATWLWTIDSAPPGSTATLENAFSPTPTITPDVPGDYILSLVVSDGFLTSAPDTVTVTALPNAPPTVDAGPDGTVFIGQTFALVGTANDPDGDPIAQWNWSIDSAPAGSVATLQNQFSPTPSLAPDLPGDYVISVVVSDGLLSSDPDTATLTAETNFAPVVVAGPDATTTLGVSVALSASASDANEGQVTLWNWSIESAPPGSLAVLDQPLSPTPSLTPDLAGDYVISVFVSDGLLESAPDTLTVTGVANQPPVVDAGPDLATIVGQRTPITASASDPDGDPIVLWTWTLDAAPAGSTAVIEQRFSPTPAITPDLAGDYVISVVVSDGLDSSLPDSVTISAATNSPPTADAGPDQTVDVGVKALLQGMATDPDGDPITLWLWTIETQPAGSTATLENAFSITPALTPDVEGAYVISLVVSDGIASSAPDTVTITTTGGGPAPNVPSMDGALLYIVLPGLLTMVGFQRIRRARPAPDRADG